VYLLCFLRLEVADFADQEHYFLKPCLNCSILTISFTPTLFSNRSLISTPKKSGWVKAFNFLLSSGPMPPEEKWLFYPAFCEQFPIGGFTGNK
jgi:hypothetical protein